MIKRDNSTLIYRYRAVSHHTLMELITDQLFLSSADTFNDEHDIAIAFDLDKTYDTFKNNERFLMALSKATAKRRNKTVKERFEYLRSASGSHIVKVFINYMFTSFVENLKQKLLVGCFTDLYDNEAMWAHYSNNGKGFVVGYDQNEIETAINLNSNGKDKSLFENVLYDEKPCDITKIFVDFISNSIKENEEFLFADSDYVAFKYFVLESDEDLNNALVHKNFEWSYEKEKRIILYDSESKGNVHVSVASLKPRLVILGENMTLPDKYLIASLCSKKGIELYVAESSYQKEDFKIGIRPLLSIELDKLLNNFQDYLKFDGLVNR